MKKYLLLGVLASAFALYSCGGDQREKTEVLSTDTVGVEYEVEQTVKEKTVEVDTSTESKTIERGE